MSLKKIDLYQTVEYQKETAKPWIWWLLVIVFLAFLYIPALVQAAVEWHQKKDIQMLHLLNDMVLEPWRRQNEMDKVTDSTDLRTRVQKINRHVALDSLKTELLLQHSSHPLALSLQHTLFSRTYLRAWEKEMEETSLWANHARPWMQFARYALFNDLGSKALAGKSSPEETDGLEWAFYKPGIEFLVQPAPTEPLQVIVDFRDQLKQKGIDLLVVVVPGKASIYPDMLVKGKYPAHDSASWGHGPQFLAQLRANGIAVVDLYTPMRKHRADSLYLRTDTHWRPRGAQLAAKATADAIRHLPWFMAESTLVQAGTREYQTQPVEVARRGDVLEMTKLPMFKVRQATLQFATEPVVADQVLWQQTPYKDDFRQSGILVLGDSFSRIYQTDEPRSAGYIALLAKELGSPLASIVSDGGASTLVREKLARKISVLKGKRLVIWEFVERDLRFGAEGWKQIDLWAANGESNGERL